MISTIIFESLCKKAAGVSTLRPPVNIRSPAADAKAGFHLKKLVPNPEQNLVASTTRPATIRAVSRQERIRAPLISY